MSFRKIIPGSEPIVKNDLVFDKVPTKGSSNPVTSDGVANAIEQGGGGTSIVYLSGTETFEYVKGLIDDGIEVAVKKKYGNYLGENSYMFARLSFVQADKVMFTAFITSVDGTASMVYSLGARQIILNNDDSWVVSDTYGLATKDYVDSLHE